jgi:hypothetical protein
VGLLLNGRFLPTTGVIGFAEHQLDGQLVDAFCAVVAPRLELEPGALRRERVSGPLAGALERLRPLAPALFGDAFLLCPTIGPWTAFFDNASTGGDPRPVAAELPDRLGCRSLIVMTVPEPGASQPDAARLRIVGFTLAAPGRAGWTDAVRVQLVTRDNGGTQVQSYGDRLPAEDDDDPRAMGVEQLDGYMKSLGVNAFDASAYFPDGSTGLLIAR